MNFKRKVMTEFIGTMTLLAVVVGSGIMGETLAGGNVALALLGNTIATGAILVVLIQVFGPISGAHFNPAVTFSFWWQKELQWHSGLVYVVAQTTGGMVGVLIAHAMFDLPLLQAATKIRSGWGQWLAEFVATFGLVATVLGCLMPNAISVKTVALLMEWEASI